MAELSGMRCIGIRRKMRVWRDIEDMRAFVVGNDGVDEKVESTNFW